MIYKHIEEFLSASRLPHAVRFACMYQLQCVVSRRKLNRHRFRKPREGNRFHDRASSIGNVDRLRDHEFKRLYRLDRPTFDDVLSKISPLLEKNVSMASRNIRGNKGMTISPKIMLLSTLRFMAGGIYLDICMSMNIGFGSFFGRRGILWRTMEAINESYEIGLPLNDKVELRRISEEFGMIAPGETRYLFFHASVVHSSSLFILHLFPFL